MESSSGEAGHLYHERTKHSPWSVRTTPHFLDWDNQPLLFKIYRGVPSIPLPPVEPPQSDRAGALDLEALSRLFFFSAGITRHLKLPGGEMAFRAAACTGALYHIEAYVIAGNGIDGLEPGVYHYDPRAHALDSLRRGDWRQTVVDAAGEEPKAAAAAALVVLTTTYWRNAWKYRARAYRHAFWDSGTLLSNFFAVGAARGLSLDLVLGFADEEIHRLLDVDSEKESAVAIVALAGADEDGSRPTPVGAPEPLGLATTPLSAEEVDYPEIRAMQRASSLSSGAEARAWREAGPPLTTLHSGSDTTLRHLDRALSEKTTAEAMERVIRKRGSARTFQREAIDYRQLSAILAASTRGVVADSLPHETTLCDPYLIVNDVEGLPSGAYAFHPRAGGLELLKGGDFRERARQLGLEQDLAGDASCNLYLLVSLPRLFERYGSRGYRVAQLEGGLIGGRVYLEAYGLGLGATGLTFYDDAVTEFFSPHAAGKSVMFLVAFGVPARRRVLFQR